MLMSTDILCRVWLLGFVTSLFEAVHCSKQEGKCANSEFVYIASGIIVLKFVYNFLFLKMGFVV